MSCTNNISIYRGDTPRFEFTIVDDNDNPLDLTNATVYFVAKANINDSALLFDKICNIIAPPQAGKCEIRLTPLETNIIASNAIAELSVEYSAENVILTIEQFPFEIKADVRR